MRVLEEPENIIRGSVGARPPGEGAKEVLPEKATWG
jgi:hypothetical protein